MNARLEVKKDPKVLAIEAKLKDTISLNVDKQPLSEAITFLQNYTGLNIVLDPKALNDEGLTSAAPVSLTVNNVQLKTALKLLLRPLGLTYRVEDEVLLITSPGSTAQMYPQTYYVGDLIMPANKGQPNPVAAVTNQMGAGPNSADGAGAMGQVGAMANPGQPPATPDMSVSKGDRPQVDMTPLIQLITTSIAPGTWRVQDSAGQDISPAYGLGQGFGGPAGGGGAGGGIDAQERSPGSIIPFFLSISLIIRHTAEVHEQIADLLRQLRRLQDLQVAIEVRFITVSDNFFEQIGVDFDFQIQSDTVGKHSTFAFPNPAAQLIGVPGTPPTTTTGTTGTTSTVGTTGTTGTTAAGGTGGLTGGASGGTTGGAGTVAGTTGGTTGGAATSTASTTPAPYLVNPIRDHAYPNQTPLVVGTAGGGLQNFSNNLMIPFNNTQGGLIAPTNAIPGAGGTFGIAFLSDVEMYFFLTAAQGDTRANVLQAPKVTTFNGASATIVNAQLQWYVAALTPIVGPGSVAFVPTPAPLPNGVILTVTPVVSADRRYVRLTISPVFNTIAGFTTIQRSGRRRRQRPGRWCGDHQRNPPASADQHDHREDHRHRPGRRHGLARRREATQRTAARVRRAGAVEDPLARPSLPQRRDRPREHQPDAHGHAPDHHPRGGRREAGDSVHGPLIRKVNRIQSKRIHTGPPGTPPAALSCCHDAQTA